jgi:hypothetical protein
MSYICRHTSDIHLVLPQSKVLVSYPEQAVLVVPFTVCRRCESGIVIEGNEDEDHSDLHVASSSVPQTM